MKLFLVMLIVLTMTSMTTPPKKKIVFFGDSITEAGVRPDGYITRMRALIPNDRAAEYELTGAGIGGNKVYDLYLRADDDVLAQKPDVVVIWIGVNDVWHKRSLGTGTDADKFERFYQALIKKIQSKGAQVILVTPAVVGERADMSNELDGDLNHYSNIIRRLAKQFNAPLVDLRLAFMNYLKQHNPDNLEQGILTTDRVHLNDAGNQLVAEAMWQVIGQLRY